MLTREQTTLLGTLYKALADRPLEPNDPRYEPYLANRELSPHAEDPVSELATRIAWSESESQHLLTGMRGNGKSTELRRLRRLLEDNDCEVVLCDARDYINLTSPVEVSDFLFSVMAGLGEQVKEQLGVTLRGESYLDRIARWLSSEVSFEDIGFSGAGVSLKASLREDPSFRRQLQERMRGRVARVREEAHAYAAEVVEDIRIARGDLDRKIVLLLDSFEQLRGVGGDGADEVYRSVENLFSGHADALRIPMLHVVYTIPPYLTPLAPGIADRLGGGMVYSLPSVHVRARDGSQDTAGIGVMQRIVGRRNERWREIFTEAQLERFALASGGDMRDFFRLIREALVKARDALDNLPVTDEIVEHTKDLLRREMLPIAAEDQNWLRGIAKSKEAELPKIEELPRLARFFDTKLVLNYRNGRDWYDVHPLVREEIGD